MGQCAGPAAGILPVGVDMSTDYFYESPHDDGFDAGEAQTIGRTPLKWLVVAVLVAAIGAVLSLMLSGAGMIAGWLLCGPIAFGIIAFFVNRDMRQRTKAVYVRSTLYAPLYWGAIVLAFAAVFVSAYQLANWAARL